MTADSGDSFAISSNTPASESPRMPRMRDDERRLARHRAAADDERALRAGGASAPPADSPARPCRCTRRSGIADGAEVVSIHWQLLVARTDGGATLRTTRHRLPPSAFTRNASHRAVHEPLVRLQRRERMARVRHLVVDRHAERHRLVAELALARFERRARRRSAARG